MSNYTQCSVDTNFLIHIIKAGRLSLPYPVFQTCYIADNVKEELQRHYPNGIQAIRKGDTEGLSFKFAGTSQLSKLQLEIYKNSVNSDGLLFDPADFGEVHAIALAKAMGIFFVITNDTKLRGPHYYIRNRAIDGVEALTYWDILTLKFVKGTISLTQFESNFNHIRNIGYDNPPRVHFPKCAKSSLTYFLQAEWFPTWCQKNGVDKPSLKKRVSKLI